MRKGLVALVVILALLALAVIFWPREVEHGTPGPAGNASVVMPAEPVPDERAAAGDDGRQVPERVEALAAAESGVDPDRPATVEAPPAPAEVSAAAAPPPGAASAEAVPSRTAGGAGPDGGAERLAALTPAGEQVGPQETEPPAERAGIAAGEGAAAGDPTAEDAATGEEAADEEAPVLDLVRVAPDGQTVVAGRAEPGETVEIMLDELVIGSAEAGADGGFVAVLETEPAAEPREMRLRVPRQARRVAAGAPATAVPAPAEGAAHPGEPEGIGDGFSVSAPFVILPGAEPAEAPVVVARGEEEVDVVQPAPAEAADRMALDRLTYESGGDLIAAGRGPGLRAVRTYADGRLVAEAPVGSDGAWRAVIPHRVAEDTALLRFDEIDGGGRVVSRLEAPFEYSEGGGDHRVRQREVVIERGNNLWRIAEQHYGEGLRYSVIFQANSNLIRDPDLIYPGQIFTVPQLVEAD